MNKVYGVSAGGDGTVYCVDVAQRIWRWNGSTWEEDKRARGVEIAVGSAAHVWIYNWAPQIFKLGAAGWQADQPTIQRVRSISAGADGTTWAVDQDQKIWRRDAGGWVQPEPNAKAVEISVGSAQHSWCVDQQQILYVQNNGRWIPAGPLGFRAKTISVGADGAACALTTDGRIFHRQNNDWVELDKNARAVQISVGSSAVMWCVNQDGGVFRRSATGKWEAILPPIPTDAAAPLTHTVKQNETLALIALTYKTSLEILARVNAIQNPNQLKPGQQLTIPV